MRLDQVRVVVRPRGVLECLDLAVLVCGRRPLGVAVAAALGAAFRYTLTGTWPDRGKRR